jgi:G3E family GTPase
MSERIPVNILTGFLGSGKTTLLNRLLRDSAFANCAVLINEFGAVGIDHHLVDKIDDGIVLLQSGCICCTIRGDLSAALRELYDRRDVGIVPPFGRVVVETTGLADPVPVVSTVMHDRVLQHHFRVGNVITTVDALNGARNFETYPECLKQVAVADRLVLTKLDLATDVDVAHVMKRLQHVNPAACLVGVDQAPLDAKGLLGDDLFSVESKSREVLRWLQIAKNRQFLALRSPRPADVNVHGDTRAFALNLPAAIDWTVFGVWLSLLLHTHGERVLRVKGLLNIAGAETPVVIHGVQHLVYPPTHLDQWPDEDRQSRLVFIVRGLDPAAIESSLHAYLRDYSCVSTGTSAAVA